MKTAELIPSKLDLLQFGALPYRTNQPMIIDGSNDKFKSLFMKNSKDYDSITEGLKKTIYKIKENCK